MNINQIATLVCRGIGLLLLIFGFTATLPVLVFGAHYGWYYLDQASHNETTWLQTVAFFLRFSLSFLTQMLVGALLLAFSRPLGRRLASDLSDPAA